MKKLLVLILMILSVPVFAADGIKITDYQAGTPADNDVTVFVSDPDGVHVTKKTTMSTLRAKGGGWTDGGANVFLTTTTDAVGIGTDQSSAKLSIVQNSSGDFLRVSSYGTTLGNIFAIDANGNVGIGNGTPLAKFDLTGDMRLVSYPCNANTNSGKLTTDANGNLICADDISDTNPFLPSGHGDTTWGAGSSYTWTMDAGTIDPALQFTSGQIDVTNAAVVVHGTSSQVKFANNMYWNGDTARILTLGSTGGTYNHYLKIDNDTNSGSIAFTSDVPLFDFQSVALKTTGITSSGNVTAGTTGTAVNTLGSAGNIAIGTGYVNGHIAPTNGAIVQGSVGVGTWSPSKELHVVGNARITGLISCDTIDTDASGNLSCGTDNGSGGGAGSGTINSSATANVFAYYAATGDTLSSQGTLYKVGSNIGIGTSTAGKLLTVGSTGQMTVDSSGDVIAHSFTGDGSGLTGISAAGSGGWTDGGSNVYTTATTDVVGIGTTTPAASTTLEIVKQSTNAPFKVSSSASGNGNYLTVASGGNVGIGTFNPLQALEIKGSTTSLFRAVNTASSSSTGGAGFIGAQDDGAATASGDRLGFMVFGGAENTTHTIGNGAAINGYATGTYSTSSIPSAIAIETAPSGSTTRVERMRVDSTGNVGVGTINPEGRLTIWGAGASTGSTIILRDSASTLRSSFLDNGNVGLGTLLPPEKLYAVGNIVATGYCQGLGNGDSSTSGNLGIGTTTPTAILTIPSIKATTGTRYMCIDTAGNVTSSASPCSGT